MTGRCCGSKPLVHFGMFGMFDNSLALCLFAHLEACQRTTQKETMLCVSAQSCIVLLDTRLVGFRELLAFVPENKDSVLVRREFIVNAVLN